MPHYFTDQMPPKELLSQYPNWREGGHTEVRQGCHEGTIWNCGPYKSINVDTDFTAGDVYFADGTTSLALIRIADNHSIAWATELRIHSSHGYWEIEQEGYDPSTGAQGYWLSFRYGKQKCIDMSDPSLFPLKYCTHLRSDISQKTVSGGIELGGKHFEWDAWSLFAPPKRKKKRRRKTQ